MKIFTVVKSFIALPVQVAVQIFLRNEMHQRRKSLTIRNFQNLQWMFVSAALFNETCLQ